MGNGLKWVPQVGDVVVLRGEFQSDYTTRVGHVTGVRETRLGLLMTLAAAGDRRVVWVDTWDPDMMILARP